MNPALGREDPGKWGALVLTVFIHAALALLLFYGVHWQRRPPEAVQVELVRALPPLPRPEPITQPEPPPPPRPAPKVEEPPPPPVKKPDIALPKPAEKPQPKVVPKPEPPPKPVEQKPEVKPQEKKPEPPKPQVDPREREAQRQRDLLNMDLDRLRRTEQMQTNARDKAALDAVAGKISDRAKNDWISAIEAKVKGNLSIAEPPGKPEAEFLIELLPGQVVDDVRLVRSSGNKALDDAMERAIRKSSPLPAPPRPEVFERRLRFVFKLRPD